MPICNASSPVHFSVFQTLLIYFKQLNPIDVAGEKQQVVIMERKGGILENNDGDSKRNNINSFHL